ncbi:hypothetical protein [Nocardia huaxiensis]|uniref:hypothetical protein n=1 Tax=Nocardia huaxiensis TaxID=2755382 RepID=UPI001E64523E|nr:hypothetical protein [Nocardia huaxiensis]UFS98339.1 hypothetical protein LPY97_10785 [Nocardia huaxiensis]
MLSFTQRAAGVAAASALAAVPLAGTASAEESAALYFRAGGINCSIAPTGDVGCDLASPASMTIKFAEADVPIPFQVSQVVIDSASMPAHPAFSPGAYTRAGGNPSIDEVATDSDVWGPKVEFAGARCGVWFHDSFFCSSKGHSFGWYASAISAS